MLCTTPCIRQCKNKLLACRSFRRTSRHFDSRATSTQVQPRPQGLLLVQNGSRRNPWPRPLKYSKNRGVFCHVTHDEMAFSAVVSSVWQPCLFSAIWKLLFKRNEDILSYLRDEIVTNFWSHFGSLDQGLL